MVGGQQTTSPMVFNVLIIHVGHFASRVAVQDFGVDRNMLHTSEEV